MFHYLLQKPDRQWTTLIGHRSTIRTNGVAISEISISIHWIHNLSQFEYYTNQPWPDKLQDCKNPSPSERQRDTRISPLSSRTLNKMTKKKWINYLLNSPPFFRLINYVHLGVQRYVPMFLPRLKTTGTLWRIKDIGDKFRTIGDHLDLDFSSSSNSEQSSIGFFIHQNFIFPRNSNNKS